MAIVNVKYARETLARIREGIELLDTNEQAVDAFQFTNRAMALQRVHGILYPSNPARTKSDI